MVWLERAVAAGYRDAANMTEDHDPDALRHRADFKELLARLSGPAEVTMLMPGRASVRGFRESRGDARPERRRRDATRSHGIGTRPIPTAGGPRWCIRKRAQSRINCLIRPARQR